MKKTQEIPAKRKTLTPTTIPQKPSGNKPIIKEQANNTLTKKLSLALEEKLNFDDKTTDYAMDDLKNEGREDQRKLSVLEKAKALIEKSKTMNTIGTGHPPARKFKSFVPKDDAFITSIAVLSENQPKIKKKYEEEPKEEPEINENEMLKNLWIDNYKETDDLAELRKLINRTKKNISDYASDLYTLKNNVNDVKAVYADLGYRVKNNDLMFEMDKVYNEVMPNGDRNKLFTYEFYDDPEREKEREVKSNKKKAPKKKTGIK